MKKLKMALSVALLAVLITSTVSATPPSVGEVVTTLGLKSPAQARLIPSGSGSAIITVTPFLLSAKQASSYLVSATALVNDAEAGTLKMNTSVTTPNDYSRLGETGLEWFNLVYSTNTPSWRGTNNPAIPYNNEFGQLLWFLVEVRSASGQNDISLAGTSVTIASNDGNVVGATVTFDGASYTPRAPLYKADGSVITSGSTSQQGVRARVLVQGKWFNGGDSSAGQTQVKNWVYTDRYPNPYIVTATAQQVGNDGTRSSSSVSTVPTNVPPFKLVISRTGSTGKLWVSNAVPTATYLIQGTTNWSTWYLAGTVYGTSTNSVAFDRPTPMEFYRTMSQR